ncbi:MAG: NACHT domain-containing protein [Achromobacter sp.]|uniref:NACHT domain-containing protein n=1 Tax=Achromobacter sp. TaxID=134375 RepID=UPI003D074927
MSNGTASPQIHDYSEDAKLMLPHAYFPRRLAIIEEGTLDSIVDEAGLLALTGNKIVLGEPGMGKSELMHELARRLEVELLTAVRFLRAKDPTKLVPAGKPLLLDGLDEAMSRRDGDAVDEILAQLEEAGSPPFVLSCRSREWQARSVTNLRQLYGREPVILTLEPFERIEAQAFLLAQAPNLDANHVLDHLASYSLHDLYRNPLTLGMIRRVAQTDTHLPATRAALFERVCALIWSEHDEDRQDEGLAQLSQDDALDAAGAISAALLFGGAEAVSAAGAAQVQQGDVRLADIEVLPKAKSARTIFSSKLFHSVGPLRAKPLHRVIAEYLGARWLASQAPAPRAQRRLLAQLHGRGGVPASLRGIHAWLAYHSSAMAERVIAEDPYGVLRYGEVTELTPKLADCLFEALGRLAEDDPYFRAGDWDSKTAAGLMIPTLKAKIDAVISSTAGNWHLRTLLIEGLVGTPLAADLADALEEIVLLPGRSYREREDAAKALAPHRNREWWRTTIAALTDQGGENAPRLARQLIQRIDADVSDDLLVLTIFAEMGLSTSRPLGRKGKGVHTIRSYEKLVSLIPSTRLVGVLDCIAGYAKQLRDVEWKDAGSLAEIVAKLIVRGIDDDVIGVSEASLLWGWLETIERARDDYRDAQQQLASRLGTRDELRRAVQAHGLASCCSRDTLRVVEFQLQRRLVQIRGRSGDIIAVFERLAKGDNNDPALRQDWQDLVCIAWGANGLDPSVRTAAELFRRGDEKLLGFLLELENPEKSEWEVQMENEAATRERECTARIEEERRALALMRNDLRAGELRAVLRPAQVYLNPFHEFHSELSPGDRLASWAGADLCNDSLIGFEAVLHRSDLRTPAEIADNLAHGRRYPYCFPIMAGFYERMRRGEGFADLSTALKQTALLLSYDDHGWNIEDEKEALRTALELEIASTPDTRQAFARIWVEPALHLGREHVAGLYKLAYDPEWRATGAELGAEWLTRFPDVPESVEAELVNCLTYGGALDALRDVAITRDETVFRSDDHRLSWLAIDFVVRFDAVLPCLANIGTRHPNFIWFLRDRLHFERQGGMLPVTIAQAEWIITEFRGHWPYAVLNGTGSGSTNGYDATDFLRFLISRIADDTSIQASQAIARLAASPRDSYQDLIRHMAAEQRQKCAEQEFSPISPADLMALLEDGPPANIGDLKALVREELAVAQSKLIGDDLDSVVEFWTDSGNPRDENRCRDRLAGMIGPELTRYSIQRITEADMPQGKRADLAFARGSMQLPIEVKGQWHAEVWDAASGQLDLQYLVDWRSEDRGVYCVLWFGVLPSSTKRRLKAHPDGLPAPTTADDMCAMLIERIPEARRACIDVVVIDLSAGRA